MGGVGGPLLAVGAMAWFASDFKAAFWIAVVPAVLCVLVLVFGVEEPATPAASAADGPKGLQLADVRRLGRRYALIVGIAAVLTFARFSEAFLILRAQNVGSVGRHGAVVMVVMSIVYAGSRTSAGAAADEGPRFAHDSAGLAALIVADLLLANATASAGGVRWRGPLGPAHGPDAGPPSQRLLPPPRAPICEARRSAIFNLICGVALLVASVLAGWLWDTFGPSFTFYAGAAFTLIAWIGLWRQGGSATELRRA